MSKWRSSSGVLLTVGLTLLMSQSSSATWNVVEGQGERKSFSITPEEVVHTPSGQELYAVVEYGVITKIFYWSDDSTYLWPAEYVVGPLSLESLQNVVIVATVPKSLKVAYIAEDNSIQAEAINHSDRVEIASSNTGATLPVVAVPVYAPVISSTVNADNSTSITVVPVENSDHQKTVEVQVISNGLSYTSIGTDNSNTPLTINNLPQDSLITVQTVIRDTVSNIEQVLQDALVHTPAANLPEIPNSREPLVDQQNIGRPELISSATNANGSKSATIAFAPIENFNSEKTRAGIMVVGPNGETTFIGISGDGGSVTVNDLSTSMNYTLKMVLIDLNTGQETTISGNSIQGA